MDKEKTNEILDAIRQEVAELSDTKTKGNVVTLTTWEGMKELVMEIIDKHKL